MGRLLIIGCGGVASVAIHKCCQNSEAFEEICIASRTKEKCDALKEGEQGTTDTVITTAKVDADNVDELIALIRDYKPDAVLNVALPYQDLTIMDACLACKVDYIDTANYEPEDTDDKQWREIYEKRCKEAGFTAYFDYSWQWAYRKKFEEAGLTALLGCGFDPGVTQAYCAYALKHEFDQIDTIDILDCTPRHSRAPSYAFGPRPRPSMCWVSWAWLALPPWSRSPTATPRFSIAAARCYAPSSRSWSSRPACSPREWLPARCPPSRSCGLASARTVSICGTIHCCCL